MRLVNAHFVRTVPGGKSDVLDCQWLQQLHTYGLLASSFRPNEQICVLRSYIRQRDTLIRRSSIHIQRMQKALNQMNVQLHQVVSDITGVTGMAIIEAIIAGERDPHRLATNVRGKHLYLHVPSTNAPRVIPRSSTCVANSTGSVG